MSKKERLKMNTTQIVYECVVVKKVTLAGK